MEAARFQRETDDWAYVPVTHKGVAYDGAWTYQIVAYNARPGISWLNAVDNGGFKGIDIQGLAAGDYRVYVRIENQGQYAPILNPQYITIE